MKKFIALLMFLFCSQVWATNFSDLKFGPSQFSDTQWDVGACLYTTTCNIYGLSGIGTSWNNGSPYTLSSGQYIQFSQSSNASYPWTMKVYNSNGTVAANLGDGMLSVQGLGTDSSGHHFFFFTNANYNGTVFSTDYGFPNSNGFSFTGTLNPTVAETNSFASTGSTSPLTSGQTYTAGPPPPSWQNIKSSGTPVYITAITPKLSNSPGGEQPIKAFDGSPDSKYLHFDKKNSGITITLSQGRVIQKMTLSTGNDSPGRDPTYYKLYGSNNGNTWTLIKEESLSLTDNRKTVSSDILFNNTTAYVYYYIEFPQNKYGDCTYTNDCYMVQLSEITFYYDSNDGVTSTATGNTIAAPGSPGSSCIPGCYSSDITSTQLSILNAAKSRRDAVGLGNRVDLYSDGSGNVVNIEQVGSWNRVQGIGGGNAYVAGFGTAVDIKQGDYTSGRNLIELYVQGNGNNVSLSQARNTTNGAIDGAESGGHIMSISITGDINAATIRQGNDGGSNSGHYTNLSITGSWNNSTIIQGNDGEKRAFVTVNGTGNSQSITQTGTGNHYLDLTLTGNGNVVSSNQTGSGGHHATINLTNVGGPSTLSLTQQGSTPQVYSITQQCANLSGCSVSVTQGQ